MKDFNKEIKEKVLKKIKKKFEYVSNDSVEYGIDLTHKYDMKRFEDTINKKISILKLKGIEFDLEIQILEELKKELNIKCK